MHLNPLKGPELLSAPAIAASETLSARMAANSTLEARMPYPRGLIGSIGFWDKLFWYQHTYYAEPSDWQELYCLFKFLYYG